MRLAFLAAVGSLALVLTGLAFTAGPSQASPVRGLGPEHSVRVCPLPQKKDEAACTARRATDAAGQPITSSTAGAPPASGLTPAQLQNAYKLTGLASGGRTVAIVDAYGYPGLEADLAAYRAQFGLPACTSASGCLRIVDEHGGTQLPAAFNFGWAQEQALDVDAVSATCPDCKIVVVQANTNTIGTSGDLSQAEQTAAAIPGVVAISNSYGAPADLSDAAYGAAYNHPGIAVTASAGDSGYLGPQYPASSDYVTAVGGTSLAAAANSRGWSESVWAGTGSGCSTANAAIPAAATFGTGCAGRAMNDVAAAADPSNGGLAVVAPTSATASAWWQIGGTSEAAPIIAAVYALAGNTASAKYANAIPYAHPGNFFDVTAGANGTCTPALWCTARTGWDGPTGIGTPNGTAGFGGQVIGTAVPVDQSTNCLLSLQDTNAAGNAYFLVEPVGATHDPCELQLTDPSGVLIADVTSTGTPAAVYVTKAGTYQEALIDNAYGSWAGWSAPTVTAPAVLPTMPSGATNTGGCVKGLQNRTLAGSQTPVYSATWNIVSSANGATCTNQVDPVNANPSGTVTSTTVQVAIRP